MYLSVWVYKWYLTPSNFNDEYSINFLNIFFLTFARISETAVNSCTVLSNNTAAWLFCWQSSLVFSCLTVGLDIQEKFKVYYSGDKKFGADNPSKVLSAGAAWRAQKSTDEAEPEENATIAAHQGTDRFSKWCCKCFVYLGFSIMYLNISSIKSDSGNTRQCNHFCKNKDLCGHDCCEYTQAFFLSACAFK